MPLLHGDLEVEVVRGENLTDKDKALFHIIPGDWSDVWVNVSLGKEKILTTGVRKNAINAVWGERAIIPICEAVDCLKVQVWDKDHVRSKCLGCGRVALGDRDKPWRKDGPVYLDGGKGRIVMKIRYTPAAQARKESIEVPRSYFPLHKGGSLTLFQDAHGVTIPGIVAPREGVFEAMADSLRRAKKFIYIAAWSLWTGTRLKRDKETLGELLKQKAAEGVRILLLIWNEILSVGLCAGLFNTFDEDTDKYFENTGVYVVKTKRKRHIASAVREKLVEAVWSHHQKLIVADDGENGIVAYVGGLDMTRGRWDTPEHQLFTTLAREHQGDFHNAVINVKESLGPREPWHDVHARLTGPAAVDLLRNFEECWRKQAPKKVHLLVQTYEEDILFAPQKGNQHDKVSWQMQVVRSIDGNSAVFSSGRVGVLDSWGGQVIDTTLHRALVRLVRRAEKFIYIENQFFTGSSQAWTEDTGVCCRNLVPLEITQRVVEKIRAREDFRVYILLPLLPEGNPDQPFVRCSIKSILHYQYLTIQMMYGRIAAALQEAGSERHPDDYLLFLCLGKKESQERVSRSAGQERPRVGSEEWKWRQRSRFMIYVHSKMALADDSHVVIGTANLNQRSLDGTRDTEVALSACQVGVGSTGAEEAVTDGAVGEFRRSLWAEHTSGLSEEEEDLADPASLAAITRIRHLADDALHSYINGSSNDEPKCHFLRYPLDVTRDGKVQALPGVENIPDFDIPVIGARGLIPSKPTV
nr:phospholipase D beta 2-like [Procambarus clarkii]